MCGKEEKRRNDRMKSKMAALFATVLIALAVVGFSYAWWNETLTINGTISTGNLAVEFTDVTCNDNEGTLNVGTCSASATEQQKVTVTMDNAYPCYECDVDFMIHNIGTIPAKIMSIKLIEISKDNNKKSVNVELVTCTTYYVDFEGGTVDTTLDPNKHDFSLHVTTLTVGNQVNPNEKIYGDLHIHIEEGAAYHTSYDFTIQILVGQFNQPQ
jgi:predicted ribosomally synthesized peptide with SipW-like signal peptide